MSNPRGLTILSMDDRAITSAIGERGNFAVGDLGVTKIEAYDESGEMSGIMAQTPLANYRCRAGKMPVPSRMPWDGLGWDREGSRGSDSVTLRAVAASKPPLAAFILRSTAYARELSQGINKPLYVVGNTGKYPIF